MKTILLTSGLAAAVLFQSATNPQQTQNAPQAESSLRAKARAQAAETRATTLRAARAAQAADQQAADLAQQFADVQARAATGEPKPAELAGQIDGFLRAYTMCHLATRPAATPVVDPELLNLKKQHEAAEAASLQLAGKLRAVPTPTAEQQQELRTLVRKAFDLKVAIQEHQLTPLRTRLARIEKAIAERKASGDKIVGRRVEDLLNPELQWSGVTEQKVNVAATNPVAVQSATRATSSEMRATAPSVRATAPVAQSYGSADTSVTTLELLRKAEAAVKQGQEDVRQLTEMLDRTETNSQADTVRATLESQNRTLPELKRRWKSAWSEYQSALQVAQLKLEAAELRAKHADGKSKRSQQLVDRGLASQSEVYSSQLEAKLAAIELAVAKQQLNRLHDENVQAPNRDDEPGRTDSTDPNSTN